MKIQKGKLSGSNVALIGVLVVVLYLVMPTGKDRKAKPESSAPAVESSVAEQSTPEVPPGNVPEPATNPGEPLPNTGAGPIATTRQPLKRLPPLSSEDMDLLKHQNPFFTKAMIAQAEAQRSSRKPQETAPTMNTESQNMIPVTVPKLSLIYKSQTGKQAAVLDDKVVYQGDVVTGNIRITSISEDGVRLSSRPSDSSPHYTP